MKSGLRNLVAANRPNWVIRCAKIALVVGDCLIAADGPSRIASVDLHSPPSRKRKPLAARQLAQPLGVGRKVTAVLLIIYLVGAICTAQRLSLPTMSREQRPLVGAVVWPFTMTVFGLLVLLALLAHWYDRLTAALEGQTADFQEKPPPLMRERRQSRMAALNWKGHGEEPSDDTR
jgi:hypothetical protein